LDQKEITYILEVF